MLAKLRLIVATICIVICIVGPTGIARADTDPPIVITGFATDVTARTAELNGSLFSLQGNDSVIVSFEWGPASNKYGNESYPASANMDSPAFFHTVISALAVDTTYYFRAKAVGERTGHGFTVSFRTLPDAIPPATITDLSCANLNTTTIDLIWTAPGNDGNTGNASVYDLRYATSAIDNTNWGTAIKVANEPIPGNPGNPESLTVTGLVPGTTYYFAIKTQDDANNLSLISNCASAMTKPVPITYSLVTSASPGGTVTVPGIGTFSPYDSGEIINLTAIPQSNYHFTGWTGDTSTIANLNSANTTITMNGNYAIAANFTVDLVNYSLITNTTGSGNLIRNPNQANYVDGASVELTAVPATGWSFSGWTGDLSGISNPQSIIMNGNKSVTATFVQKTHTLTVTIAGTGNVTRSPNQSSYYYGSSIQLTTIPASGWSFGGWSGDLTGSASPTSITINGNKSVTATFIENSDTTPPANVNDLVVRDATVSSLSLSWTAPGDDDHTGTAAGYDVRYSLSPITALNFSAANHAPSIIAQSPGKIESITINGLIANTTYYFALKTADEVSNNSGISNIARGTTLVAPESGGSGGSGGGFEGGNFGGGGGFAIGPGITDLAVYTDAEGLFNIHAVVTSDDKVAKLDIAKGVIAKDKLGQRLRSITITKATDHNPLPKDYVLVGATYDFGPDGTTFQPAITLSLPYDRSSLPIGIDENDLTIVVWDSVLGRWNVIGGTVDLSNKTITVPIGHFSSYGIAAVIRPAHFVIGSLSVSPGHINPGEKVTIAVAVKNEGNLSGNFAVVLTIDDYVAQNREISLAGGSSEIVTFNVSQDIPGNYRVEINGQAGQFEVQKIATPAALKVSNLQVSSDKVKIGDTVSFTALVENAGDTKGVFFVPLKINGMVEDSREIALDGGATEVIIFSLTEETAGNYAVDIAGVSGSFAVLPISKVVRQIINWWLVGTFICAFVAILTTTFLTVKRLKNPQPIVD